MLLVACAPPNGTDQRANLNDNATPNNDPDQHFLSPVNRYDKLSLADDLSVGANGNLTTVLIDLLGSDKEYLKYNLHYDSANTNVLGKAQGWRDSFSVKLDEAPNYDALALKTAIFETPRQACEQGWETIANQAFRGLLATAQATFDEGAGLCQILVDDHVAVKLIVWNQSKKLNQNLHTVKLPNGVTHVFTSDEVNDAWVSIADATTSLSRTQEGGFIFTDSKGKKYTFDAQNTLMSIEYLSKILTFEYGDGDGNGQLQSVTDPFGEQLLFEYEDEKLVKVKASLSGRSANLAYAQSGQLDNIALSLNNEMIPFIQFAYNDDNLLSKMQTQDEVPSTTLVVYDDLNRVTQLNAEGLSAEENSRELSADNVSVQTSAMTYDYSPASTTIIDHSGNSVLTEYTMINSTQKPLSVAQGDSKQTIVYGEFGNLSKVSSDAYDVTLKYNVHDLLMEADIEQSGHVSSVRFQYEDGHRKPTVIQRNDDVTFIEYNDKGLQQKATRVTALAPLDASVMTAIKLDDIRQLDNVTITEKQFVYTQHGLLESSVNGAGKKTVFEYNAAGKKIATIKPDGTRVLKTSLASALTNARGKLIIPGDLTVGRNAYDARSSNTQVFFVGGAGDENGSEIVQNYEELFSRKPSASSYKSYKKIGTTWGIGNTTDPFGKIKNTLIAVGHSWGGDSAVEASKQTRAVRRVNLLITVDAVGTGDWNDGADHWIAIYAEPGSAWITTSSIHLHWGRGWLPWPHWHLGFKDNWSKGDWTAFWGGKGSYSTYDPGNADPDKMLTYYGSHEQFGEMIDFMESKIIYRFGLTL